MKPRRRSGDTRACRSAYNRYILRALLYFKIKKGEPLRTMASPFAVARALRRLEQFGLIRREGGVCRVTGAGDPGGILRNITTPVLSEAPWDC